MIIKTVNELNNVLNILQSSDKIAFDFETIPSGSFPDVDSQEASLHHKMCEIEGLALRSEKLEPVYIPFLDTEIPRIYLNEQLGKLFCQESLFIAHNIQFDAKIADHFFGARPINKFCTLIGYWYLDENALKDKVTLSKKIFGVDAKSYKEAKNIGSEEWLKYTLWDAEFTYQLYFYLKEHLEPKHFILASEIEMDFIDVLIDMTLHGTTCDLDYLKKGEEILTNKAIELEAKIFRELGEFNLGSSQQLCEKLYGIKISRKKIEGKFKSTFSTVEDYKEGKKNGKYAEVSIKTESGAPSTNDKALSKLDTPTAKLIQEYRGITKLLTTYAIGYQKYVVDGKIYPTFNNSGRDANQYGTVTGRLCVHPDTLIEMPRDLSKHPDGVPLKEITVGDVVYSFDEDKELCLRKVKWVGPTKPKRTLIIHTDEGQYPLIVSHNHLVRKYSGDWCYAKNLKIGDRLLCMPKRGFADSTIKAYERRLRRNLIVTKIEEGPEEQLWDLEIEDTHTFIGNDIALHNSSSAPNMQNISHNATEGWWLREAIQAPKGYKLVVADEGQLEVRLLAHFSKDPYLIQAIKSGEDVHLATAKLIFNKQDIDSEERRFAKTMNFAICYGQGVQAMAESLFNNISEQSIKKARLFRKRYFKRFEEVESWVRKVGERMASSKNEDHHVKTIIGRKRRLLELPTIYSSDDIATIYKKQGQIARCKRQAVNSIIQGSASDVLKAAMVHIHKEFKEKQLDAHILLQIHDELVVECKEEIAEEVAEIVQRHMEFPFPTELRVPLEVHPTICDNWSEGKD
jgi:DNA polymerase I-like protein with 3'-5' exonuclease and polymerase domains